MNCCQKCTLFLGWRNCIFVKNNMIWEILCIFYTFLFFLWVFLFLFLFFVCAVSVCLLSINRATVSSTISFFWEFSLIPLWFLIFLLFTSDQRLASLCFCVVVNYGWIISSSLLQIESQSCASCCLAFTKVKRKTNRTTSNKVKNV